MKFIYCSCLSLLSMQAMAVDTSFTTIQQAEEHCPAINQMVGEVDGSKPWMPTTIKATDKPDFESSNTLPMPLNTDGQGYIKDIQFRSENGIFGKISGEWTECYYYYPATFNLPLTMVRKDLAE